MRQRHSPAGGIDVRQQGALVRYGKLTDRSPTPGTAKAATRAATSVEGTQPDGRW